MTPKIQNFVIDSLIFVTHCVSIIYTCNQYELEIVVWNSVVNNKIKFVELVHLNSITKFPIRQTTLSITDAKPEGPVRYGFQPSTFNVILFNFHCARTLNPQTQIERNIRKIFSIILPRGLHIIDGLNSSTLHVMNF